MDTSPSQDGSGLAAERFDRRSFLRRAGAAAVLVSASSGGLSVVLSGLTGESSAGAATKTGKAGDKYRSRHVVHQSFTTPFGFIPSFIETYVAAQLGFWKKQGLDVTVHGGEGTASGLQSVIDGSSQYGRGGGTDIVAICSQDIPVIHICQAEQVREWEVGSLASKPLKSPADLKGKTIGIVSPGGETQILLNLMLDLAKVPLSSVNTQVVGVGAAPYELAKKGSIDGWMVLDQTVHALEKTGASLHTFDVLTYAPVPMDAYVASLSAVKRQRDDVVGFVAGLLEAYEFLKDRKNWPKAYTALKVYSPATPYSVLETNLEVLVHDWYGAGAKNLGVLFPDKWAHAQELFYKTKAIHKKVPVDRLIGPSIVTDAKKRL